MFYRDLSDRELLSGLEAACAESRNVLARILRHLAAVEERRLHLEQACPSLFELCTKRLGMSEDEAYRRIVAARLVRRFPRLLEQIERGELHLSALMLLRDHLTEANHDELASAMKGKTKRQVQEVLAERFPTAAGELRYPLQ